MNKIYWKAIISGWHEVSKEQAIKLVRNFKENSNAIPRDKKDEYINQNKLKGITVEELMKGAE